MKAAGSGTIIFTGGLFATSPFYQFSSLSIGKAGIRHIGLLLSQELQPAGIHVAIVTVCGIVKEGTYYDPNKIADEYWVLHSQPHGEWKEEFIFRDTSTGPYPFEKK